MSKYSRREPCTNLNNEVNGTGFSSTASAWLFMAVTEPVDFSLGISCSCLWVLSFRFDVECFSLSTVAASLALAGLVDIAGNSLDGKEK